MKPYLLITAGLLTFSPGIHAQTPRGSGAARANNVPATTISAISQNLQKFDGYFNFYYDEKTDKILLEVDKFDQEFLYFGSLAEGAGNAAEKGNGAAYIVKFIKAGPKVFLLRPEYNYRTVTENQDEVKAVESAFAKSVIWGFTPLAVEGDKALIDLTPFLMHDGQGIAASLMNGGRSGRGNASAGGGYRIDESRSAVYLPRTKDFPKNAEFETMVTFTNGSSGGGRGFGFGGGVAPDPSAVTVHLHHAFVELPEPGYKLRKFDPRTGFNAFSYTDFATPMTESLVKRYIRRHRLQKKDPSAKIGEPVKPIIYYVDRGAPEIIKKALIEGGSWWNQAFEAAGYKDAFQVKELPEGADPMDIRYNMVNWISRTGNPRAFSYGSSYSDPRTGEIIKGVVTLGADRHRQDYLIAEGLLQPYEEGKPIPKAMEEMALARIRQLSAHEIGHTLGFTHNFAASPKDRASVMDYPFPRITVKADGSLSLDSAYAKGIGSWDKRAVIWGYSDFAPGTDENSALDKIMEETLAQGHQYIPDIGGYTHPVSHQWDDGQDPIQEMDKLLKVRRMTLDKFSEKAIQHQAPMATIEEVLVPIYLLHRYQIEAVAKSIGGLYFTHALKGDGQEPTRMVDPDRQWKAFDALISTITPEALALPEALIKKIPPRPTGYQGSIELFSGNTGPTFDPIAAAESAAAETLSSLLNAERAARLAEYHARDNKQPGFLAIVDKLFDHTWKANLSAGYPGELQTMVNNLTLKYLLQLAANTEASEVVRGQAILKVTELKQFLNGRANNGSAEEKANALFALNQISAFEQNPNQYKTEAAAAMPPGAPIMPNIDFLKQDQFQF